MNMKYMDEIDLKNKKVILRLDLNVPIKNDEILDDTKILKSLPTIRYLINNNCKILLLSHLGKIKTEDDLKNNSLKSVGKKLSEELKKDITFIENPIDPSIPNVLENNDLVLLENTRFMDYPDKKESKCDMELAKFWASAGDIFINDAFGTSHRKHASNYGISKFLESAYGILFKEELDGLMPLMNKNISKPFVVVMGGAKVDDKLNLINSLLEKCDYLLLGGGIANTFLKADGFNIGSSLCNNEFLNEIKTLMDKNRNKIIYPTDVVVLSNGKPEKKEINDVLDEDIIYDIGSKTIDMYKEKIDDAKTIFINGTVGLYEDDRFAKGTKDVLTYITDSKAIKIAGGGDSVSSINRFGLNKSFDFLSTGGGATLEYIASGKIACFEDEL